MKTLAALAGLVLSLLLPVAVSAETGGPGAHGFTFTSIEGDPLPLSGYKGRAVLVVNTASFCGFTPQYKGLQALYDRYQAAGLTVLGVPSNDFGNQEPGSASEIKQFCETHYDISFPMTEKQTVAGPAAHPFYKWAKSALGRDGVPRWNFHKILIAPDGSAVQAWSTGVPPDDSRLIQTVEQTLATASR